jgi:hypothetical protein
MPEWIYKATPTKATHDDTHDLAVFNHFLCRSAYERATGQEGLRLVAKVAEVAVGDTLHYYFRKENGKVVCFGSFVVESASAHPGVFAPIDGHGALVSVIESPDNDKIVQRLRRGYEHDPELKVFTGWALRRLATAHATPVYEQTKLLPGPMTNLWPYPDPELPKRKRGRKSA